MFLIDHKIVQVHSMCFILIPSIITDRKWKDNTVLRPQAPSVKLKTGRKDRQEEGL